MDVSCSSEDVIKNELGKCVNAEKALCENQSCAAVHFQSLSFFTAQVH